jgi:choline dehydrogenase-like flavoprotein
VSESQLTPRRARALAAVCDTFVPAVEPPGVERDDPTGFWGRRASDLDVPRRVGEYVVTGLAPQDRDGLLRLLDLLHLAGITRRSQTARERLVRGLRRLSPDVADGLDAFRSLTMLEFYGRSAPDGRNPNWEQLGYPGPPDLDPPPERLATFVPPPGAGILELEADVCVIGSGSGGGVVAGELAAAGRDVVVLEAGGHLEGPDLPVDETTAMRTMYWRAVPSTDDGNVVLLAGAVLGGGSTVNWMNCVRPPTSVRETWAREHGLHDVAGAAFDAHLDAVLRRISATTEASDLNGPNDRLRAGAAELGWAWHATTRNADLDRYDPVSAGHIGYGDRSGSKQGTLATYLRDAVDAGARVLSGCRADRVTLREGRATGVEATLVDASGGERPVRVRARHVVVAAGALETPALLLRSGIGGPAVGHHLRLHPVPNVAAYYDRPSRAWWGAPQTVIVDEHREALDGHGYLVETPHLHPGLAAAALPWISGRDHKLLVGRSSELASFIAVSRDHGAGRVTVDDAGEAVVAYPLDDELDQRVLRHALGSVVRLHAAAGAHAILDLHPSRPLWRRGEDLDAFVARVQGLAFGRGARTLFSAHQMGSARMGWDPRVSVADPEGQLHDTPGVWIGDTSAFPTAVGSNPMVTCMALARRTAHALLAD